MLTQTRKTTLYLAVVAMVLLSAPGFAATPAKTATAAAAPAADASAADAPVIDAQAMAALDRMGKQLRTLKQFTLTSDASTEVVLDSGQKIQLDGTVNYKVQRPNQAFVELSSDRKLRQFIYDGKKLVVYSPRLNYYAEVNDVGKTLGELLSNASEKYGVEFPLADLFLWGSKEADPKQIQSAIYVGPATVRGEKADQYAFRQEGVDWQIWISQASALPLKLNITSLDDPALPQYQAVLNWDTKTAIPASTFTFVPPKDAGRITLLPADAGVANEQ